MNILMLAHFAGSPRHGMVFGHYYLAREWVRRGHTVTIVASSFVHTRHQQPELKGLVTTETIDGIRYIWLRNFRYAPLSRLGRVANILGFTAMTWLAKSAYGRCDAVVCSSHHPLPIYTAAYIARRDRARLVFEVRDLWPLTLIELGSASPRHPLIALMQKAEDYAYARADAVVSVLPQSKDYMMSRGMAGEKFIYIPNGVPGERKDEGTPPPRLPFVHRKVLSELKAQGRRLIGYTGRIGLAQVLDAAVLSLRRVKDPRWALVVLGMGPHRDRLRQIAAEAGVADRLFVLEPVPQPQVAEFLGSMDIAYLGLQDKPLFRYGVSPTKLNDYLLAERLVIAAINARVEAIEYSGAGVVCAPEEHAIAAAIDRLGSLPDAERAAMGRRGRAWLIEHRSYEALAGRFMEVLSAREAPAAPTVAPAKATADNAVTKQA